MPRLHLQPDLLGQFGVGPDADRHHHQVGCKFAAVLEAYGADPAVCIADKLLRLTAHDELQATFLQRLLQQFAGDVVELALHQPGCDMHHGHFHAPAHQAVGGLQPEQATTDHHRFPVLAGSVDHGVGIGDVAVGDHALQVLAWQRQHERVGAGADQQPVVTLFGSIVGAHEAPRAVDLGDLLAGVQPYAVVTVPVPGVQNDLVHGLLPGQNRR